MLRNYLIVAWRNLVRHKVYSLINIAGLAIGMAGAILIFLLVRYEWTYDAFHEKADQIYRVYAEVKRPDETWTKTAGDDLVPPLEDRFPEVVQTTRLQQSVVPVRYHDSFFGELLYFAEPGFFEVFSFPFLHGDPGTALQNPNSVVISAETAKKYFGDENPIGKILHLKMDLKEFAEFSVTGVLKEVPGNSSIQFSLLLPAESAGSLPIFGGSTFVLLADGVQVSALEGKLPRILDLLGQSPETYQLRLQPLTQIHYDPSIQARLITLREFYFDAQRGKSASAYPWILAGMGLIVLVMACINFIALAIGRAAERAREIGVRKVIGAQREQLIQQFWGEAVLLSFIALALGLALAEWLLPTFNELVQRKLVLDYAQGWTLLVGLAALALFAGLLAGSYPAIVLSGFHPIVALRGTLKMRTTNPFGRALLILQFTVSTFFLISVLVMIDQVRLLRTKNLGFDAEQVIVVQRYNVDLEPYLEELHRSPMIRSVSLSQASMGASGRMWDGRLGIGQLSIDYNYLETLGIQLIEGRNFSPSFPSDETDAVIINQTLAKKWGWDHPLGRQLTGFQMGKVRDPRVIGVIKDFHQFSLFHQVQPTALCLNAVAPGLISVRVAPKDKAAALEFLRATWQKVSPDFSYTFHPVLLDDYVMEYYQEEERWERLLGYTTFAALFLSGLGALGLTSLAIARRTKEVGIRKVLGASAPSIVVLLSKEFTYLVIAANVIAWPLAWYTMHRWLENFAYRIELGPGVFVLGGVLVLVIAWLTVSYHAIRAARANPVEALRYE